MSVRNTEGLGHFRRQLLRKNTHIAARDFTVLHDLVHDVVGQVGRDRETDALVAAGLTGQNGGVDTNQVAAGVDERAARIAAVNGGVGLDEVLKTLDAQARAALGADDAHGHRLAAGQTERLADG